MCGFFTHGFWWQEKGEYVVVADWEINSHTKIREYRKDLIPANAQRWGFNPVNGEPLTNEAETLPEKVKEKICLLREMYFPNKEAIADWIKKNYDKQGDKKDWDFSLMNMLEDKGKGIFSQRYCEQQIKDYEQWIKDCEQWIKDCEQGIKYCEQGIKDGTGTIDTMNIDIFIDYFFQHPNSFWSERIEERKVEYESFVKI